MPTLDDMGEFAFFWRAIRAVARILLVPLLGWDVQFEGREHLPDGTGPWRDEAEAVS